MSKRFNQRGADDITIHYIGNGVMTGFSQWVADNLLQYAVRAGLKGII